MEDPLFITLVILCELIGEIRAVTRLESRCNFVDQFSVANIDQAVTFKFTSRHTNLVS